MPDRTPKEEEKTRSESSSSRLLLIQAILDIDARRPAHLPLFRGSIHSSRPGQVASQALLALGMGSMTTTNVPQTVSQQQFVDTSSKQRGGDVDQDGDGSVFGKGALAEEDGRDDSCAQISSCVRADGDGGKAPDDDAIGEADGDGCAGCIRELDWGDLWGRERSGLPGETNGWAGSRHVQITRPWEVSGRLCQRISVRGLTIKASTKNSMRKM
jgi:hypothetical protein